MAELEVLYEDNHIIAINKKCGDIVQGDKTGDKTLGDKVKEYLKVKYNKPGNVFLGVTHRIDRPTSGIVLFARTSKMLARLNELFKEERAIRKTYWAVVDDKPAGSELYLEHWLTRDAKQNKSFAFEKQQKDSQKASLTLHYIQSSDRFHLLEIELHTGRHHQIRAQLAAIGLHIKGDLKYGFPRSDKNGGIHLHARKIEFVHPVTSQHISLVAPPPKDPLWDYFIRNFDRKDQTIRPNGKD